MQCLYVYMSLHGSPITSFSCRMSCYRPVKLLGATAIDDKLQEEVPETIEQPLDVELENSWFLQFLDVCIGT